MNITFSEILRDVLLGKATDIVWALKSIVDEHYYPDENNVTISIQGALL